MMGYKTPQDKEAHANYLRSTGLFSEDEIKKEIADIEGTQPDNSKVQVQEIKPSSQFGGGGSLMAGQKNAPPMMTPAPASEPVQQLENISQARSENKMDIPGQVGSDLSKLYELGSQALDTTTGKLVAGGLGLYGAYKAYPYAKKLADKFFGGETKPPADILAHDFKMGAEPPETPPPPPPPSNKLPPQAQFDEAAWRASLSPRDQEMLARSEAAKASKAADLAKREAAAPPPEPPQFLLKQPVAPVAAPEVAPTAAPPAPTVEAPKTVAAHPPELESKLGKPDLITGSGMPAYQGQGEGNKVIHKKGEINSLKDIPKGYVFVPGGQNMDIVRNAVGQPTYTQQLKGTGGYPTSPQAAYEQSRGINQSLNRPTREELKASGQPMPEPTPSITQKIAGSKTVKVAGTTGALILATDLANAAVTGQSPLASTAQGFTNALKSGDYGMAASHAAELLNLHPLGMLGNALFGTSPEELQTLRNAQQARTVGAGRGIAPPSAYQR